MGDLDHVRKRREGKKEGEHLVRKGKVGARGGISQLEACDGSVTGSFKENYHYDVSAVEREAIHN